MTRLGFEPTIYHNRGEHSNHYASDAVRIIRSCMDADEKYIHVDVSEWGDMSICELLF
jgi:hypothetical protein